MKKIILSLFLIIIQLYADQIYATFNIKASQSANLAFSSSGIVDNIYVDINSIVKKGAILAKLDNNDLKASVAIAKANLKYAKRDYDRQLKIKTIVEKSKLDSYALKYQTSISALKYQQALLDKTILKAPFDGVIISKNIEIGDVVSGLNPRTIFQIQSKHKRKLILEFDQKYWQKVKIGNIFKYKIDGSNKLYQGYISKIYPTANINTRKIKAEVEVDDFIVGLFGDGYIQEDK